MSKNGIKTYSVWPPCLGRYPGCILIGAKKCGTGALRDFLIEHPNIIMVFREVHFFDKHLFKVSVSFGFFF